jgi:23S rRNA pseudouridine1911/1915/1917 synthase
VKNEEYTVTVSDAGVRLDHFLSRQSDLGLSRSQIVRLIESGHITVNQNRPKPSYKLRADDKITLTVPPPAKLDVIPENIPLSILYEDDDLIVVNKARGMTVHPGAGRGTGTLVNALLSHCSNLSGIGGVLRPGIVHRLDKDTSGLIVVAKSDLAHQALAKQFKARQVSKKYLALVHGIVKQGHGVVETLIGRHRVKRKKMAVLADIGDGGRGMRGKEAITHYRVVERFKNYALVELELKTGRTHQIRVHMSYLGFPLVGDPVYGKKKEEFKVAGQLLHAAKLGFKHPRTGENLEFTAPLPEDMQAIIKKLQKR